MKPYDESDKLKQKFVGDSEISTLHLHDIILTHMKHSYYRTYNQINYYSFVCFV